jgi:hypothetical protein
LAPKREQAIRVESNVDGGDQGNSMATSDTDLEDVVNSACIGQILVQSWEDSAAKKGFTSQIH